MDSHQIKQNSEMLQNRNQNHTYTAKRKLEPIWENGRNYTRKMQNKSI